jgi:hypothetical protein
MRANICNAIPVLTTFHKKPLRFWAIKSLIVVVSDDNRESISPLLTLSKKLISCLISDVYSKRRKRMFKRETAIENMHVRRPPMKPLNQAKNKRRLKLHVVTQFADFTNILIPHKMCKDKVHNIGLE